uniref:FAE domain-containing protein n=1 Tax=Leersia perrieri TaxID=77586 RepID=A0A0D9XFS8_9ORYZ
MRSDVIGYNLSGMGCATSVIGVDVPRNLLVTHDINYVVVVSAKIMTVGWYNGKDHSKLLLNYYFRTGCSAALLTKNHCADADAGSPSVKYRLVSLTRTNQTADDQSYRSGYRDEDDEGITGFTVGQGVGRMRCNSSPGFSHDGESLLLAVIREADDLEAGTGGGIEGEGDGAPFHRFGNQSAASLWY